jgi:hypothetical protein
MRDRTWLEARRSAAQDSTRSTDRLAIATVLAAAALVMLILVVRGLLWPAPAPDFSQLLNPQSGQIPPHVQSGFVQR